MVVWLAERREARAARWEMDLSGGTARVPLRVAAGSTRVLRGMVAEDREFLFGELADGALGEVAEGDGADAEPLKGDQVEPDRGARSAYYAVTALADGEVEGGLGPGAAEVGELRGVHRAVFEGGACGEGLDGSPGGRGSYPQLVFL